MTEKNKLPSKKNTFSLTDEESRLRRDIYRPDMEKPALFVEMIRRNNLIKKAKITHKKA